MLKLPTNQVNTFINSIPELLEGNENYQFLRVFIQNEERKKYYATSLCLLVLKKGNGIKWDVYLVDICSWRVLYSCMGLETYVNWYNFCNYNLDASISIRNNDTEALELYTSFINDGYRMTTKKVILNYALELDGVMNYVVPFERGR